MILICQAVLLAVVLASPVIAVVVLYLQEGER